MTSHGEALNSLDTDVVIVGAGISGLYCAWRLSQEDPGRRITIIERLDRTGGRLDTDLIEIRPGEIVREEEGGMRFNYGMTELMQLTKAMGLCDQIVPFPMASSIGAAGNTNRFCVRGRTFTAAEATAGGNQIWGELYNLAPDEEGLSASDIVANVYRAILHANGEEPPAVQSPEFWARVRNDMTWKQAPLRDWQMAGLLRDMGYSDECIQMLSETIGFAGPFKAPINAGDSLQILADFPEDPTYFTFTKGFSSLPNAVRERLGDHVQIMLSTNVNNIERSEDGFSLQVSEAGRQRDARPHANDAETTITGSSLVLAVAAAGMQELYHTSPALNQGPEGAAFWDSIHASRGMRLLKINLYFDSAWWLEGSVDPPVQFGPNFSSLPINAVYPFYALDSDAGDPAALTIYCDFENTAFWQGVQNVGPKFSSPLQDKQSTPPVTMFPASNQVVFEAKKQLCELFSISEVPEPVLTSYRLWDGADDFEYAYHQWRLGVDDVAVRAHLANPLPGVYCCNEAFSDMHGWVNGSLRSSELALGAMGLSPFEHEPCVPASEAAPVAPSHYGLWGA